MEIYARKKIAVCTDFHDETQKMLESVVCTFLVCNLEMILAFGTQ